MATQAPPSIPPRPVKQQAAAQGVSKLPDIPPRPISKRLERSVSPGHFPRSPLNEPWMPPRVLAADPTPRPSVAYMPTPGEEGIEYANIDYHPTSSLAQDAGAQTRLVAEDLQLHAPKPSLPKATAAAQVQDVARAGSAQAGAYAGTRASHDDVHVPRTKSRQSFSRPGSAASGEHRRSMVYADEIGPAEMGLRVPINPLLGDVQAPSPVVLSPQVTGDSPRPKGRKKSVIEDVRPPGSYGLHGHGIIPDTRFEREWYAKHPELLEHEEGQGHGVYEGIGSGRGGYALSSDELNKIVRQTASRGSGFGTNENIKSYPDEQIGYMASEVYQRSQQNTPHPEPLSRVQTHEPAIESPLRGTSFPTEDGSPTDVRRSLRAGSDGSENDAHHIDLPQRKYNKVTGGEESMNETQEAKPYLQRPDNGDHSDHRIPILADDEVAKDVGGEYMQAAISPKFERRTSQQDEHASGALTPTSRPSSRPGSIYQMHSASHSLSRFLSHQDDRDHMHTPLEDVAEYEPLFDDDDGKKELSHLERFKRRPDALQKRFPSQDIWEDTPSSAMYVAEVSTPDLPSQLARQEPEKSDVVSTFESPEAEHARKGEPTEEERKKLIPAEERLAKSKWAPHLRDDMPTKSRPALSNRFPSQDVWEDTPDSSYLVTTVGSPQLEDDENEEDEESSPAGTQPPVPARPAKSRLGEGASSAQIAPSVPPSIPARPQKRVHAVPPIGAQLTDPNTLSREVSPTELRQAPSLPDRPKPQIPPRPARKPADDELTKTLSGGSVESNEAERATRAKPQVPARPAAGNFASLKGNFMSDLNKKLGLGPPKEKEKEPEPEEDAKPLEDARKGRARGPQRRAPAKSPAGEVKRMPKFSMFSPVAIWQINDDGHLSTIHETEAEESMDGIAQKDYAATANSHTQNDTSTKAGAQAAARPADAPAPLASGLSTNTAGEPTDPVATGDEDDGNLEGELTRKTTSSTVSGQPLDREDSKDTVHMLPASRMTTASDTDPGDEKLEKVASKEPEEIASEEPVKVRNEQVSAANPGSQDTHQSADILESVSDTAPKDRTDHGNDEPKEPMNEDDVDYDKLEAMTAQADGKVTAEENPDEAFSSKKVVE